jgi:hypothetical protein
MQKRVIGSAFQKVTVEDFNNLGEFTRDSLDTIVGKLLIPDIAFSGFQTVQSGPAEVTVGLGYLFSGGRVYFNDTQGGFRVDLLARVPAATRKIIAITTWGTEQDTQLEPRTFLTDALSRATVARETTTEHWRWANIGAVSGIEGPDPQQPPVPQDVITICWVTMNTTGIESILMNDEGMAPTLREEDNRLNAFDIWRLVIGSILDTLRSDLNALSARINGLAPFGLVRQIAQDTAILKERADLPDTYVSYGYDNFLTPDESDLDHVDWYARIEEGVRFFPEAVENDQLGLFNQFDPLVKQTDFVLLPYWEEISRIANLGTDEEESVSSRTYVSTTVTQKMMSRTVTRYGPPMTVCTNATQWWDWKKVDLINWTYRLSDTEVFAIVGSLAPMGIVDSGTHVDVHNMVRLEMMWTDTITEPYWEYVTQQHTTSGALLAQTFVNAQEGWMTSIDLYFSRVAAAAQVVMYLCETNNGMPSLDRCIAMSVLQPNQMKVSPKGDDARIPTKFTFPPTLLRAGRYAIVLATGGNHWVWTLTDSNIVAGSLFYSTDGGYFEGYLDKDLAFEIYFAKFARNTTRVMLQPLHLQGGIAAIKINSQCFAPVGTRLFFEFQKNGVWYPLSLTGTPNEEDPSTLLAGLPAALPFRADFVGSESIQP